MTRTSARARNIDILIMLPTLLTAYLFSVLQLTGIDDAISAWFYDPARHAFPLQNDFWLRDVLHDGGHDLMVSVLLGVFAIWLLSHLLKRLRPWRRTTAYLALSMTLGALSVSVGKQISNTDCPWDLSAYGGSLPHVLLFEDKPDDLPRGRCFPGGHSSSGFALFGLYFVAVMRGARRAWPWLLPALLVGGTFSVAQWIRGAHFPSHDLISAWLCWMAALLCHLLMTRSPAEPRNERPHPARA
ncbi:MAG: phosphatase PAP2 family protein [Gammaproteobacteria bacterium]|nr:phosphatase PAP2 family protein [Gammaproteobacteria bacterium]